jgi:hypothetical protein
MLTMQLAQPSATNCSCNTELEVTRQSSPFDVLHSRLDYPEENIALLLRNVRQVQYAEQRTSEQ